MGQRKEMIERPEQKVLLTCLKAYFDPVYNDEVEKLLEDSLDWQEIFNSARHHNVLPLLLTVLSPAYQNKIPSKIYKQILEDHRQVSLFSMVLNGSLMSVVTLLQTNGISVLNVKGGLLAERLYGSPLMRNYADVDILVDSSEIPHSVELLTSKGCTLLPEGISKKTFLRFLKYYHHGRLLDSHGVLIELHSELSGYYVSIPLVLGELEQFIEPYQFNGMELTDLNDEMLLIFLCMHSCKHNWAKLDYICTIYKLLKDTPSIKWDVVIQLAQKYRMMKRLIISLLMMEALFAFQLPEVLIPYQEQFPDVTRVAGKLMKNEWRCNVDRDKIHPLLKLMKYQPTMVDKKLDAIRFVVRSLIIPEHEQWQSNNCMNKFFFLYYLYKPYRALTMPLRKLFAS